MRMGLLEKKADFILGLGGRGSLLIHKEARLGVSRRSSSVLAKICGDYNLDSRIYS
jgi:hypothetical protein